MRVPLGFVAWKNLGFSASLGVLGFVSLDSLPLFLQTLELILGFDARLLTYPNIASAQITSRNMPARSTPSDPGSSAFRIELE